MKARAPFSADEIMGIRSLEVRARTVVDAVLTGAHKSRRFGASTEFAEHKEYTPGDDLRALDWRAYARFDKHYVRRFEAEAKLEVHVVVDTSGSMSYRGDAAGKSTHSKLDFAATLASALCWVAHKQNDAASLTLFAQGAQLHLPARSRKDHLELALDALNASEASGPTDALGALKMISQSARKNALIIVMSDLLEIQDDIFAPLGALRKRGADVMLLHMMHPDEIDFPFDGVVRFIDLEGDREVQVDANGIRASYLEEVAAFFKRIEKESSKRDLRYSRFSTDTPPARVLREALFGSVGPRSSKDKKAAKGKRA